MLPDLETLLILQDRDQKIDQTQKDLANLPNIEEDIRDRLKEESATYQSAKDHHTELEIEMKKIELDIETRKSSIEKLRVQQFETKKNEEFHKMGDEIKRYEKEITELEDTELELMEKADVVGKEMAGYKAELADLEKTTEEEISELGNRKINFEKEISELTEDRKQYSDKIDEDLLETYSRLFKGKEGIAVVALEHEVCQGCHMKVTKSTMIAVKSEKDVAHCESCGRILFYGFDQTPPEADIGSTAAGAIGASKPSGGGGSKSSNTANPDSRSNHQY